MAYISFFGLLVMIHNFTDYESNYTYVAHILSMDTTTANQNILYRAIESPLLHHRIYWFIITMEVIYTVLCMMGTYQLYRKVHASADDFHEAKKLSIMGILVAIFIYYVCLQTVGVEWFDMDTSQTWNAKDWARHIVDFIFPVMIYMTLKVER
jgi:predicted small integral membrane protein